MSHGPKRPLRGLLAASLSRSCLQALHEGGSVGVGGHAGVGVDVLDDDDLATQQGASGGGGRRFAARAQKVLAFAVLP